MILSRCNSLPKKRRPPGFSCTGAEGEDWEYAEERAADGTIHWELAIKKSCTVNFSRVVNVDIFFVGAGYAGGAGSSDSDSAHAGDGGAGGDTLTQLNVALTTGQDYALSIGQSSGGATSGFGFSSADSGHSAGARGGGGAVSHVTPAYRRNALQGGSGVLAFGAEGGLLWPGRRYANGGGGGGALLHGAQWNANGGDPDGGGMGGYQSDGQAGNANTGNGGGGGSAAYSDNHAGGAGGSGLILLRDARGGNT